MCCFFAFDLFNIITCHSFLDHQLQTFLAINAEYSRKKSKTDMTLDNRKLLKPDLGGFHLHLFVFPFVYQFNSRIGVLVKSSFAND